MVNGVRHPFREETDSLPQGKKISVQIDTYRTQVAIDPARFDINQSDSQTSRP